MKTRVVMQCKAEGHRRRVKKTGYGVDLKLFPLFHTEGGLICIVDIDCCAVSYSGLSFIWYCRDMK